MHIMLRPNTNWRSPIALGKGATGTRRVGSRWSRHAEDQLARGKSGDQAPAETQPAALASSRRNQAGDPSQKSRTGAAAVHLPGTAT
jgi:hypothetical protein